ncbi:MAG: 1,4-alpha-glucan branching protein GlgB [Candidatus Omnitrophica bacterium]|nr:1,4-alpha-glucan branching protein GlgB [Candidatus Omnitrophota bacterium]
MFSIFQKKTLPVIPDFFDESIRQFRFHPTQKVLSQLGAVPTEYQGRRGTYFSLYAPHALGVSVLGPFNQWKKKSHLLCNRSDHSGIWEGFVENVGHGDEYQFYIQTKEKAYRRGHTDPMGRYGTTGPERTSKVWQTNYLWNDRPWIEKRKETRWMKEPMSIYEVHCGSWKRTKANGAPGKNGFALLTDELINYVKELGFTHIELLPITEHPFYGSWGYQPLGYFSPSARYGSPEDLMRFIDKCHQNGIGVFLDWVPSHFPADPHGLVKYDGTSVYEKSGEISDWSSCLFDLGSLYVTQFLIASAMHWIKEYHFDGIRVDAVASMLYLDYGKNVKDKQWSPNFFGGKENLEAISFLRRLNREIHETFPGVCMIAEESTAWPNISKPEEEGGLNFNMKWNMGWMHDTLSFMQKDQEHRLKKFDRFTFPTLYAFDEHFILPLSHDEVVHGKSSLLGKMPFETNTNEKFEHLRFLLSYMYSFPGKKLLFMGAEIGQWNEWNHDGELDWELLQFDSHRGVQTLVKDLNAMYRHHPEFYAGGDAQTSFIWGNSEPEKGVVYFFRTDAAGRYLLVVCNVFNVAYEDYPVRVPKGGEWSLIFSSQDKKYAGYHRVTHQPCPIEGGGLGGVYEARIDIPRWSVLYYQLSDQE